MLPKRTYDPWPEKGAMKKRKGSYVPWGEKVFRRWKEKATAFRVQRRAHPLEPRPWLSKEERRVSSVEQRSFLSEELCLVANWITNNRPDTHARMRLFFPAWCMHMKAAPMPNETRASARVRSLQTSATDLSTSRWRFNFRYVDARSKTVLAFALVEIREIDFRWILVSIKVKYQGTVDLMLLEEGWSLIKASIKLPDLDNFIICTYSGLRRRKIPLWCHKKLYPVQRIFVINVLCENG